MYIDTDRSMQRKVCVHSVIHMYLYIYVGMALYLCIVAPYPGVWNLNNLNLILSELQGSAAAVAMYDTCFWENPWGW